MTTTWSQREQKRKWARNHPEKVREANRLWRAGKEDKLRRQARLRMRRYRARIAKSNTV